ncbi:hypothetical protein BU251_00260 [Candidatus Velamenicoccus archaeovorus]|uniref:DUF5666 domain-containing protein n=2 Tax=Velamenicoccus archaeovorus TaxID=1930593 RepID=A0A410P2F9_VELA1|nr:hypothetical protein BU251_00260 [Candidatus Velamenicoccus archaeovorus]
MLIMKKWSVGLAAVCFVFAAAAAAQAQQNAEEAAPMDNAAEVVENAMQAPVVMNEAPAPAVMNETAVPAGEGAPAQAPAEGAPQTTAAPAAAAASAVPMTAAVSAGADQKAVQAIAETAPQAKVMEIKDEEAPTEWVWGEVVSTDKEVPSVTIKHLDYNTYEEVKTTLLLTGKTLFENVKDLSEIKAGDRITADYRVQDGKSVAEMIVVDRPAVEKSKDTSSSAAETSSASQGEAASADVTVDTTAEPSVDVMDQGDTAVDQGQVDEEVAAMNAVTETDNAQNPS